KKGFKRVVSLDESGRVPISGPVTAADVTVRPQKLKIVNCKLKIILNEIKDSKKLSQKKRERLYKLITENQNIKWGIAMVSEKVIDKINIKNAAELAMEKALQNIEKKIKQKADFLLIDGNTIKNHKLKITNHKLIVKADEKVFSCAAASILAKVARDRIMKKEDEKYPQYGFARHKGYPTKFHKRMLKKYGPCVIHRTSFSPVRDNMVR
ncbi:MAG: ribonuclease HII, partial [bacterium]|nr:ribonuclease HII [bacterium]